MELWKIRGRQVNRDDVIAAMRSLVQLNYDRWQEHAEPVKPATEEADLMIAEALNSVLKSVIDERKKLS